LGPPEDYRRGAAYTVPVPFAAQYRSSSPTHNSINGTKCSL